MTLYLHMKERAVTTLGPGKRYALWVSGCNRNCSGCTAPDSHDMTKGIPMETGVLTWEILLSQADGLTISGGEPFLQATALAELIRLVRQKQDLGVIVYTGFTYEELLEMPEAAGLLAQTDLLIDGPYIRELDDGLSLRGSSNQRIIPLTDRYRDKVDCYGTGDRVQEVFYHAGTVHYVGIPTNSEYITSI
jgi:anaerobic ribonucleoside-triphosphate reductase activating protein